MSLRLGTAVFVCAFALAAAIPAVAGQDPGQAVPDALERASRALANEPALAPETKEALQGLIRALQEERGSGTGTPASTVPAATAAGSAGATSQMARSGGVLDRVKVYGDFRFRHETNTNLAGDSPEHNRQRIRFRIGGDYDVSERLSFGARLSTGSRTDPNSPHQTLGEGFHRFDINLDRAFFHYRPSWAPGSWLKAGKFAHPFWRNPVYGDLLWDSDVQPEGGAAGHRWSDLGGFERVDLVVGEYVLVEQEFADEASVFVAQLAAHGRARRGWKPSVALGYYRYTDLTPDGATTILTDNAGNATVDNDSDGEADAFASRFELIHPMVSLSYDGWRLPLNFAAEYIHNTDATGGRDRAWLLGASLGALGDPGSWRLFYSWAVVEQDSLLSAFAGDDLLLQTNHRSHIWGIDYRVSEHFQPRLWGLVSTQEAATGNATDDLSADQTRLRLDLNFKF